MLSFPHQVQGQKERAPWGLVKTCFLTENLYCNSHVHFRTIQRLPLAVDDLYKFLHWNSSCNATHMRTIAQNTLQFCVTCDKPQSLTMACSNRGSHLSSFDPFSFQRSPSVGFCFLTFCFRTCSASSHCQNSSSFWSRTHSSAELCQTVAFMVRGETFRPAGSCWCGMVV